MNRESGTVTRLLLGTDNAVVSLLAAKETAPKGSMANVSGEVYMSSRNIRMKLTKGLHVHSSFVSSCRRRSRSAVLSSKGG